MADAVVFDISASLTLTGEEFGADTVQQFITDALAGVIELHASFVSLTEVEYITRQEEGAETARQRLADIRQAQSATIHGLTPLRTWPMSLWRWLSRMACEA